MVRPPAPLLRIGRQLLHLQQQQQQGQAGAAATAALATARGRGRGRAGGFASSAAAAEPAFATAATAPSPSSSPIGEVVGRVQSLESFSTVDGPGIRMVAFLSGCAMRCVFCSNPDTWSAHGGNPLSSKEVASHLRRLKPFLAPGGGGLTCSGGEPLLQPHFTAALFREARALGLTTVLDTTGQGTKHHNWDVVLPYTDMALFCVKSLDSRKYTLLTGLRQRGALRFADELLAKRVPFWVRYVLIPGWTDSEQDVAALGAWARGLYEASGGGAGGGDGVAVAACAGASAASPALAAGLPTSSSTAAPPDPLPSPVFQGIELLPYHVLGRGKWQALGLKYPLEGVATPKRDAVLPVVRRLRAEFGVPVLCAVDDLK
jgi:pyruvate formate lyase activating enzyme